MRTIFIGFDPREAEAFAVCRDSIKRHRISPIPIYGLVLDDLRRSGLYSRPMEIREDRKRHAMIMWDMISEAPMATEFANSRFLIGHLAQSGFAVFMDCDMLVRAPIDRLFEIAERDTSKAVWCVKHKHEPKSGTKMDGQVQAKYARKNWSSLMVLNVNHPSNAALTVEVVNTLPGRDLHRFFWLQDDEIGELGPEWNWLVGHSPPVDDPKIVHFTSGGPWLPGYERVDFAEEWREARNRWAEPPRPILHSEAA